MLQRLIKQFAGGSAAGGKRRGGHGRGTRGTRGRRGTAGGGSMGAKIGSQVERYFRGRR